MVSFVLDASAILRFLDGEAGVERVGEIIKLHVASEARCLVSAIHWGEVSGTLLKRLGPQPAATVMDRLKALDFEIVTINAERAARAARIKVKRKIPYADAFGVELAGSSPDHLLVTADFDVTPAVNDIRIEFLPRKLTSA